MIAWPIKIALESKIFDKVIVSTDDDEIADISRKYGAETPFVRPRDISDDHTVTTAVMKHAIESIDHEINDISAVCCIYATSPFLIKNDLKKGLDIFNTQKWDYVFSASEFQSSIFRAFEVRKNSQIDMFDSNNYHKRSQDFPIAYHDAGQFYWGSCTSWLDEKPIFSKKSTVVLIPRWRVQDIDTPDDWANAELMAPFIFKKINKDY